MCIQQEPPAGSNGTGTFQTRNAILVWNNEEEQGHSCTYWVCFSNFEFCWCSNSIGKKFAMTSFFDIMIIKQQASCRPCELWSCFFEKGSYREQECSTAVVFVALSNSRPFAAGRKERHTWQSNPIRIFCLVSHVCSSTQTAAAPLMCFSFCGKEM